MSKEHEPVLVQEVLEYLDVQVGGKYIDATVGGGGHGEAIIERGGRILGLDMDSNAIEVARHNLKVRENFILVQGNFADIEKIARENNFVPVDGVLFDLGMSSMQLESSGRGFSFARVEPLDMRMDPQNQSVTASDLVNALREDQLIELFSRTARRDIAQKIARAITRIRGVQKIETTDQLVEVVSNVIRDKRRIHPATTVFLALRMVVNDEPGNLQKGLAGAIRILADGGRILVISFHSGEDRIVKQFFAREAKVNRLATLTKSPITPSSDEIKINLRSRSAKLRVAEKL